MNATVGGIAIGAALAIAALWFGFWGFLLMVIAMALGAILGRAYEGKLDLGGVFNALAGKRSSS